jgi:hypothetical protein
MAEQRHARGNDPTAEVHTHGSHAAPSPTVHDAVRTAH